MDLRGAKSAKPSSLIAWIKIKIILHICNAFTCFYVMCILRMLNSSGKKLDMQRVIITFATWLAGNLEVYK